MVGLEFGVLVQNFLAGGHLCLVDLFGVLSLEVLIVELAAAGFVEVSIVVDSLGAEITLRRLAVGAPHFVAAASLDEWSTALVAFADQSLCHGFLNVVPFGLCRCHGLDLFAGLGNMGSTSTEPAAHHPALWVLAYELSVLLYWGILGSIWTARACLEALDAGHAQCSGPFNAV